MTFIIHHSEPTVVGGIDPGAGGALAFIDHRRWTLEVHDMPTFWEEVKGKKRRRVDVSALSTILNEQNLRLISTEKVHAMPQMDVKSIFSFGRFYGQIEALAAAIDVERMETDPAVWKRTMQVDSDKDYSRKRCGLLVPAATPILTRKTDHDRAEAILLAFYGLLKLGIAPQEMQLLPRGVATPKPTKKR